MPLPPSLRLPEPVTDLSASRTGGEVRLRWTTSAKSTDKLILKGPLTAEICRETVASGGFGRRSGSECAPVLLRMTVMPGVSEAVDLLGPGLTAGPAQLLAYRIQMRNKVGRTAGASAPAYAAAGAAPGPVDGLRVTTAKAGAVVEWTAGADAVELDRTTTFGMAAVKTRAPGPSGLMAAPKEAVEVRFKAGQGADPGGTLDRTALAGRTYRYTAQRVRTVTLGGQTVAMRGVVSAGVSVAMVDVFPPDVPTGLVASTGVVGDVVGIDLSWDPGTEAGIAGYRVYRAEGSGEAVRVGTAQVPAYRDTGVVAGREYRYRVTAVDAAGNESGRSGEVREEVR